MAASIDTVVAVLKILGKHLTAEQKEAVLADLAQVEGNASFKETIKRLITANNS